MSEIRTFEASYALSGTTQIKSFSASASLSKLAQVKSFSASAKLKHVKSFTAFALITDPNGTFRGSFTTADRDDLPALQPQDTVLTIDAESAPSGIDVTRMQYWTGSEWLSGYAVASPVSGVTNLFTVPTTAGWRVEEGDPTYPIRYWDGTDTNFSVDDAGDVFVTGNLSAGSIDIPDASSPGFHVDTSGVLDITTSAGGEFHVNPNAGADVRMTQYADMPSLTGRRAEGTSSSPTALAANSVALQLDMRGYNGSGFVSGGKAQINLVAAETWGATANGTYITFKTTKSTTTTAAEVLRLTNDGGIQAPNIAAPATPASGNTLAYFSSSDKKLHVLDDTGTNTALGAGGGGTTLATDTLWSTAGELAYSTANDTATVLAPNTGAQKFLTEASSTPSWFDLFGTANTFTLKQKFSAGAIFQSAALATNATTGFAYIPTCAGTPTGTPSAETGTVPMVYDTTNNLYYVYNGGAWTYVELGPGTPPGAPGYIEMSEISAPSPGSTDTGRLYLEDNGSGKTRLVIKFNTGAAQVIATQP